VRRLAPPLLLLVGVACSNPADSAMEQHLQGVKTASGVQVTNSGDQPVYYAAFEKGWATQGLFIWAPCTNPARCASIAAHGTVTIPFQQIDHYTTDAKEGLVYYWELSPTRDGAYEASNMQSLVVAF
jgi:hypothetical protein